MNNVGFEGLLHEIRGGILTVKRITNSLVDEEGTYRLSLPESKQDKILMLLQKIEDLDDECLDVIRDFREDSV